ncbi:hypothetical protein EsDP_00005382 [Epichloe bromicola]|uniref:Phospholipid-binding protein n=1 Tax=Epichloe bromicola TaxID=79588 RepID=A0ABQ0CUH2_9HYPO
MAPSPSPSPSRSRPASPSPSPSPSPSQLPPIPSSPVYSIASTANPMSRFILPLPPAPRPSHAVLTKSDLEASQQAYSDLLATAKTYRLALANLSNAASQFGSALEACARLKEACAEPISGPHAPGTTSMTASFTNPRGACTADTLLSASGVHHLVANHQQILCETVYRSFEVPLLHELDKWQTVIDDEEETYQAKIKAQSKEVKRLEKEGLKLHKQRRRDVARFRAHLVELTSKLDGLTTLHADHSRTLLRESQDTSGRIVDASCSLVRAEVDIFESLARKGWTGGGLDDLLEKGTDLFATEEDSVGVGGSSSGAGAAGVNGVGESSTKLFSILPPKSILADSASEGGSARPAHTRGDSLLMDSERYQSLAALATEPKQNGGGAGDTDSVFSYSADFNKPRGARPFSPQPIRRIPADVTFESLGAMGGHSSQHVKKQEEEHVVEEEEEEEEEGANRHDDDDENRGRKRSPSPGEGEPRHHDGVSSADAWGD